MDLQSVIQVSSLESMRMLRDSERSLSGFCDGGCLKDTLRKLRIGFSNLFLPGKCSISYVSPILSGVLVVFVMAVVSRIH